LEKYSTINTMYISMINAKSYIIKGILLGMTLICLVPSNVLAYEESPLGGPCGNIGGIVYKCEPGQNLTCKSGTCSLPDGSTTIIDPEDPGNVIGKVDQPVGNPIDKALPEYFFSNYSLVLFNLGLLIGLFGVLIYIALGAIKWIMAGGDAKALQSARDTIIHACIGLILLASVFAITKVMEIFIGGGVTLTDANSQPIYRCGYGHPGDYNQCINEGRTPAECAGASQCHQIIKRVPNEEFSKIPQEYGNKYCTDPGTCESACQLNDSLGEYKYCLPL
jgi:hypothetical protein